MSCTDCGNTTTTSTTTTDCIQDCGCLYEVNSLACVRHSGPDIDCIGVVTGETLESIITKLSALACANSPTNGVDGQSVESVTFTSTTDAGGVAGVPGATDTYTLWGDLAQTVSIGTFVVTNPTNGTNGTNGTDGIDGTDGVDGSSIIATYNDLVGIGNDTDPDPTYTLFSEALPSTSLSTDGDEIEVFAVVEYSENDPVNLIFRLSPTESYTMSISSASDEVIFIKIRISRISQTSQLWTIESIHNPTALAIYTSTLTTTSTTFDLQTSPTFEIIVDNTVAGANQVVLKKATIYEFNI